jgi:RimJ/RimL family protein N-acetyltransferase
LKAPERLETERLVLHRPAARDLPEIFGRYAADAEVTRYMGFATHASIEDTRAFLALSDAQWQQWPAGAYLVRSRDEGRLLGSTGFGFETSYRAATGYVFARDAWGKGYASESLGAIVALAPRLGLARLYAVCHTAHRASSAVLERCGFTREGLLRRYLLFPNLGTGAPDDVYAYAVTFGRPG